MSRLELLRLAGRLFPGELLSMFFPEQTQRIDLDRVEFLDNETYDEVPDELRFPAELTVRFKMPDEEWYPILLHVVFVEAPFIMLPMQFQVPSTYLMTEYQQLVLLAVMVLRGGPAGLKDEVDESKIGDMVLHRVPYRVFGLADCRAEDQVGKGMLPSTLSAWMGSQTWDLEERKRQASSALDTAVDDGRLDAGRRRLLESVIHQAVDLSDEDIPDCFSFSADQEVLIPMPKEMEEIMKDQPATAPLDTDLTEKLLRAFFPDAIEILGGCAVQGLDLKTLLFHDTNFLDDSPTDFTPAAVELVAEVDRRSDADRNRDKSDHTVLHLQVVDSPEGTNERTLHRYMQLRVRFPGRSVVQVVVLRREESESGTVIGTTTEWSDGEMTFRFHFRTYTLTSNSAEQHAEDPRPVAWALAALMRPWAWSRGKLKSRCLERILYSFMDLPERIVLWDFVQAHLPLDDAEEAKLGEFLADHARDMRKVIVEFLDQRLGPTFPPELRRRLTGTEDPMEVHRLMEEIYEVCVEEELVIPLKSVVVN